jgi:deoxyribonuclease V
MLLFIIYQINFVLVSAFYWNSEQIPCLLNYKWRICGSIISGKLPRFELSGYNCLMRFAQLHEWQVSTTRALEIQRNLAGKILTTGDLALPRLVAGLDVSVSRSGDARAAAVVLTFPELELVETKTVQGKVSFPYVPGLLSFREIPITLEVCKEISNVPDLLIVDGQGYAHPRRIGLASHLGLILNLPTIGCAKSHLYGTYSDPGPGWGDLSQIEAENGEVIGAVVRTKADVKPLFISVGHRITLSSAVHWVLQCSHGYRLPEPTRLAHLASRGESNG